MKRVRWFLALVLLFGVTLCLPASTAFASESGARLVQVAHHRRHHRGHKHHHRRYPKHHRNRA
ncbi:MAG TPA: hypothetical protein VLV49_04925 [Terriglobales bacterium]|nr:hypothetical protein [Terriglobales bacterium]